MDILLKVYTSQDCWGCEEARKIVDEMRVEFSAVRVELITRETAHDWPETIIATPAYTLNGKLVSLGNPSRDHLRNLLADALGEAPTPPG